MARAVADNVREHSPQGRELALAADHRRAEAPHARGRVGQNVVEPKRRDRLPARRRVPTQRLRRDRSRHELVAARADQELRWGGELAQTPGYLDGFSSHGRATALGDHLARFNSNPGGEHKVIIAPEVLSDRRQRPTQLDRGSHRSEGVVLVHHWDTEYGDQDIAGMGLNAAAVALEHSPQIAEAAR